VERQLRFWFSAIRASGWGLGLAVICRGGFLGLWLQTNENFERIEKRIRNGLDFLPNHSRSPEYGVAKEREHCSQNGPQNPLHKILPELKTPQASMSQHLGRTEFRWVVDVISRFNS
jgi:hypothetical protein